MADFFTTLSRAGLLGDLLKSNDFVDIVSFVISLVCLNFVDISGDEAFRRLGYVLTGQLITDSVHKPSKDGQRFSFSGDFLWSEIADAFL